MHSRIAARLQQLGDSPSEGEMVISIVKIDMPRNIRQSNVSELRSEVCVGAICILPCGLIFSGRSVVQPLQHSQIVRPFRAQLCFELLGDDSLGDLDLIPESIR